MKLTAEQKEQVHRILRGHHTKMIIEAASALADKDKPREAFYDAKQAEVEKLLPIFASREPVNVEEEEAEPDQEEE